MNAYVGITICLVAFWFGTWLFKKSGNFFLFSPLFVAMILGVIILKVTNISFEDFNEGGKHILFFLEPATVAFAIPLYKKREVLFKYPIQILFGIIFGTVVSAISVVMAAVAVNMTSQLTASLLPLGATTAIAVPVADSIGGIGSIAAFTVIFNGIIVYALGDLILKTFKTNDPIAKGLALGAAGHALGVAVAMKIGDTEAAMASISVVVVGIVTSLLIPMVASFAGII